MKNDYSPSNTKARELHQPSGFACLRVVQVPEHNGKLFTYSGDNVMTVFYEHLKDQEAYIKKVLSEKLPMKELSPKELIRHAASKQCTQCDAVYSKKIWKLDITITKLEHRLGHTVINAIFNSNIPGDEHLLLIVNKETMQRKESLLIKLLEINSIRNEVRRGIMMERILIQTTAWMKMISWYL